MAEYDTMGNYTGYDESYSSPVSPYDFEEEDRRKEELKRQLEAEQRQADELASQVSHKQEVTEYGDGSRTVKTTKEIPAGPVSPDYNANIARQESGNRPDIGYHDPGKSSAYGTYGMTAAGYEDARRANPNLPADITQATPEQQTAAQDAYTQQNAKYLQAYGVEPNANTLAAAHFLGAKGLSDYLKSGYISPAAAAANGGEENVKRIVSQRLGGQQAPASGAAQQPAQQPAPQMGPVSPEQAQQQDQQLQQQLQQFAPQAQPAQQPEQKPNSFDAFGNPIYSEQQAKLDKHVDNYTTNQNDPQALMKLSTDEGTPDWMKERSRNRAADIITQQREMKNAQEKLSTASENDLTKMLREKTTGGSFVKALFYSLIGATTLAQAESAKLGIGSEKIVTGADGKAYMVKVAANGLPLEGTSAETGKKLTSNELISIVGGAGDKNEWHTVAGQFFTDKEGNQYQAQNDKKGNTRFKSIKGNTIYSGSEPLKNMIDERQLTDAERKQGYKRENINSEVMATIQKKRGQDVMGALADFEAQSSVPVTDEMRGAFIKQYGGLAVPGTTGQAAPTGAPAAAGKVTPIAPEGSAQAAPVAPVGVAQPLPTTNTQSNPAVAPTVPTKPGYDANNMPVRLPSEGAKAYEKRYKEWDEDQKTQRELGQKSSEAVIKHRNEVIVPAAAAASDGSQIVKNQLKIVEDPKTDMLFGLYNKAQSNSGSDKNWALVRDIISGKVESKEGQNINEKWAQTNLKPDQYSALMGIISGNERLATAEIKSGGFGAQISNADRASAEKMQIDIGNAPALGFYNQKAQQLYNFDSKRAKQAWAVNKQFKSPDQLENEWSKESARLTQQYQDVADERNAFLKANSDNKSTTPGLVREAYKRYPVPTFDPNLNNGQGGWNNPVRQRKLVNMLKG
jgi:hypothetical protein